jgi:NAD(P)-dependent dehydrogenase (short-subunit alcohol dehydrogenase family)
MPPTLQPVLAVSIDGQGLRVPAAAPRAHMKRRLEGRIAVVTGGTRGIGRAIVRRFASEGAQVFYCAPDPDGADTLATEIAAAGGVPATFVRANIVSPPQLARLIGRASRVRGVIDILVNNAALGMFRRCDTLTMAEWTRTMDTNVRSAWLTAKYAWPSLQASRSASIITISSIHARQTSPACIPYAPSKAAVSALMRCLAIDGGPFGIRANTICPGLIRTAANAADFAGSAGARRRYRRVQVNEALGRIGEPDDVAGAALFLASSDAAFFTGRYLLFEGGGDARLYGNVYEEERRAAAARKKSRRSLVIR